MWIKLALLLNGEMLEDEKTVGGLNDQGIILWQHGHVRIDLFNNINGPEIGNFGLQSHYSLIAVGPDGFSKQSLTIYATSCISHLCIDRRLVELILVTVFKTN